MVATPASGSELRLPALLQHLAAWRKALRRRRAAASLPTDLPWCRCVVIYGAIRDYDVFVTTSHSGRGGVRSPV
jgi:hypothetical protein